MTCVYKDIKHLLVAVNVEFVIKIHTTLIISRKMQTFKNIEILLIELIACAALKLFCTNPNLHFSSLKPIFDSATNKQLQMYRHNMNNP